MRTKLITLIDQGTGIVIPKLDLSESDERYVHIPDHFCNLPLLW